MYQRWIPKHCSPNGRIKCPPRIIQLLNDEKFSFFVALIFALISAVPIYAVSTINLGYTLAPYQWEKRDLYTINFSQRATWVMNAAVCIPMCADVLIDAYVWFFIDDVVKHQHDKISKKKDMTVTRLNMMERLLFLFGASLQPLRCTKVWTAGRTNICLIIMGLGCIFKNFRYIIVDHNLVTTLYECGNYLLNISFAFQMLFTMMCFVVYCTEKYKLYQLRKTATVKISHGDDIQSRIDACDEFYTNSVPAGHMVALMLSCCSDIYYLHGPTTGDYSDQVLWERVVATAMMIITVIVIVLESRIKHNEVERTMLRELMSTKKSYVRYLSHELRTPLNTTFLGIGLLADEIKDSKDPDDKERFNILRSMNVACKSAVDILDDLITFDKLESGHLKIHRKVANIPTLLREGVEACVVDARLAEVDLALYLDVEAAEAYCNFLGGAWNRRGPEHNPKDSQGLVATIENNNNNNNNNNMGVMDSDFNVILKEEYLSAAAANSNRDIASDDSMHVDPVKCQQVLHSLVVFCIKHAQSKGLVDVYAMCSESSLGDDLGLSVHSIGSNHHSRSGVVMSNIYRAAAAVSSSSPVPRRNGSVGSFREAPSHNSAVSRTLNSNGSPGNSPANSRKATKEGSQMHLLTQSNKASSFRHSFRKEQRSLRQAIVEQRPTLLPSLNLPDALAKGNTDHPQNSMAAPAATDLLVVPTVDAAMGAKISSLGDSGRSTRPSLQPRLAARDPANERYLDPLAPAAQINPPQISSPPGSFITRFLRSSLDALPRLGLSLTIIEPSHDRNNNDPPQHTLSRLPSQQSHASAASRISLLSASNVSHVSSRFSMDSAPRGSMDQLPNSARLRLPRDAPPRGSLDVLVPLSDPNSARSSGRRSGRLSAEGKLPVFSSRVPGSPAATVSRVASRDILKPSLLLQSGGGCDGGDVPVETVKVDYLMSMSMGTAREAGARGGEMGVADNSTTGNNGMLSKRSGAVPPPRSERSVRSIRLSKDMVTDPSDAMPLPKDVQSLAALYQQLDHPQHDQARQQQKKDRKTLVPLRDPMRSQVPSPWATPRSFKDQNDAAGGGGGNGDSDGGSTARRVRQGSMAWMNEVLFARARNNVAMHRDHCGLEWLTIVIVAKGQGLDTRADSDEIIAARVPSEIRPFNPEQLVAGGSADMSLWIAKGIVEQHGGRIHMFSGAGSTQDMGCHFIVELPLHSHTHPPRDHAHASRGTVSGTADLSSRMWVSGRPRSPGGGGSQPLEVRRESEEDYANTPKDKQSYAAHKGGRGGGGGGGGGSLFDRGVGYLRRMSVDPSMLGGGSRADRSKVVADDSTPSIRARRVLNATSGRGSHDSLESVQSVLLTPAYSHITSMEPAYRQLAPVPLVAPTSSTGVDLPDSTSAAAAAAAAVSMPTTDKGSEALPTTQTTTPLASLPLKLQLPSSTHSHPPPPLAAKKKKTLLVVDDSDLTRKMLCRIVRAQGFDVEEADDGDVAVQMVQHRLNTPQTAGGQSCYECILMDFIMPRLDGPSATKEIRALGYAGLVLGVTGNGQEFDVKHFKHMGANEVFTKPLDVSRLKEYLRLHKIVAT